MIKYSSINTSGNVSKETITVKTKLIQTLISLNNLLNYGPSVQAKLNLDLKELRNHALKDTSSLQHPDSQSITKKSAEAYNGLVDFLCGLVKYECAEVPEVLESIKRIHWLKIDMVPMGINISASCYGKFEKVELFIDNFQLERIFTS